MDIVLQSLSRGFNFLRDNEYGYYLMLMTHIRCIYISLHRERVYA